MRIGHRVTDRDEPVQKLAHGQRALGGIASAALGSVEGVDGMLERHASNEAHGIARGTRGVGPQRVDRHDTRVLESPGDFGLLAEATQALGVAHTAGLDELEHHVAVQLDVARQENFAQGPGRVEA